MFESEGIRRLVALAAVALAVGAETFVAQELSASEARVINDYGVELLMTELSLADADVLAPMSIAPEPPRWLDLPRLELRHDNGALSRLIARTPRWRFLG